MPGGVVESFDIQTGRGVLMSEAGVVVLLGRADGRRLVEIAEESWRFTDEPPPRDPVPGDCVLFHYFIESGQTWARPWGLIPFVHPRGQAIERKVSIRRDLIRRRERAEIGESVRDHRRDLPRQHVLFFGRAEGQRHRERCQCQSMEDDD